ncbi:hypothetical protein RRF57_011548 [Xylaria bambusicola]|uniref:Uncharacterized protein n=1 Tax=Xylaria bambusicola TaxID=326684 RepID=A0AAN7V0S9_9PEZI
MLQCRCYDADDAIRQAVRQSGVVSALDAVYADDDDDAEGYVQVNNTKAMPQPERTAANGMMN